MPDVISVTQNGKGASILIVYSNERRIGSIIIPRTSDDDVEKAIAKVRSSGLADRIIPVEELASKTGSARYYLKLISAFLEGGGIMRDRPDRNIPSESQPFGRGRKKPARTTSKLLQLTVKMLAREFKKKPPSRTKLYGLH